MPPDQKAFQMWSIWLLMVPVIICQCPVVFAAAILSTWLPFPKRRL